MIYQFIREKEVQGRAQETINAYKITYNKFTDYFGDSVEYCGDIAVGIFTDWIFAIREEGLSVSTINHHFGCIRAFIYWCMDSGRKYIDEQFKIELIDLPLFFSFTLSYIHTGILIKNTVNPFFLLG